MDYFKVQGDRILPFTFSLNEEDSVLYPSEGEVQKFCYDIAVVGTSRANRYFIGKKRFAVGNGGSTVRRRFGDRA